MPPSTIVTSSIPKLLCLEILRGCGILTEEHPVAVFSIASEVLI